MDIHKSTPHVPRPHHAFLLIFEFLVLVRKEPKGFLYLILFLGGDVILLCKLGLAGFFLFGSCGGASSFGGLVSREMVSNSKAYPKRECSRKNSRAYHGKYV